MEIKAGLSHQSDCVVEDRHLATAMGSGDAEVLATPALVAFMEKDAKDAVARLLPEGSMTVGTRIEADHLKASKLGAVIHIQSEVTGTEGKLIHFKITATDSGALIGEAQHTRAVVDRERFMARLNK